jgi:hypothetical protein
LTDTERLDWLERETRASRGPAPIWYRFSPMFIGWGHVWMTEDDDGLPSMRAAMDAAMKASRRSRG